MKRVYVFAGGGTGGHIFPALAIAERLRARDAACECVFVCSKRPLDAEILNKAGEKFVPVAARVFGVRPLALLRFCRGWGPSVRAGRKVIREARASGAEVRVVAMGGFVAAPIAQAARAERAPVLLVNMDAVPGKANRWIARRAERIVTSAAAPGVNWELVPPIVRAAAKATGGAGACRSALGLDPGVKTLLVTGASQGARSINLLMTELVGESPRSFAGWQIIHQTGAGEDEGVRAAYERAGIRAIVKPFFDAMGQVWGAADLAVSRAGAGSVAEAWANAVPTLFLPYPFHKDQHQRHNARPLVDAGAAVMEKDLIEPAGNVAGPGAVLTALLCESARRESMRASLRALGPADGADRIAAILASPR